MEFVDGAWTTSGRSGYNGNCVECLYSPDGVHVRDTKWLRRLGPIRGLLRRWQPTLRFTHEQWSELDRLIRTGHLDTVIMDYVRLSLGSGVTFCVELVREGRYRNLFAMQIGGQDVVLHFTASELWAFGWGDLDEDFRIPGDDGEELAPREPASPYVLTRIGM